MSDIKSKEKQSDTSDTTTYIQYCFKIKTSGFQTFFLAETGIVPFWFLAEKGYA